MADEQEWARDKSEFVRHADDADHPIGNPGPSPLVEQFGRLTWALLDASTVAEVLEQVVDAVQRTMPGADLVSITLRAPDGTFHTPVETDPLATKLDQVQYDTGQGPCVDAARMNGPGHVRSDNLESEPAWPRFAPIAAAHGYSTVLSTTLLPHARPPRLSGALNIYARQPAALHHQAQDTALLLATHASLALAETTAVERGDLRAAQLQQAIASRDVIGQAKGILMQRRGITAAEAFDLLRSTSQDLNVKLTELANTLVNRRTELDPPGN